MTTYKGIKGLSIQTIAGDPGTIVDGLIWYDSIARKVQGSKTGAGTWASGGNLNTAKGSTGAATDGANTTGLVFGGLSATATLAETESYNGSSWTEVGDLNTGRSNPRGGGISTSALAAGGGPSATAVVEEWNGSSWTETTNINTARQEATGWGDNAEGILIAGGNPVTAITELWDGSSWTEVGDLNTARRLLAGFGATYQSGILAGGLKPPGNTQSLEAESWNGTSWTETTNISTGRAQHGAFGTSDSDGYVVSGYNFNASETPNVEQWDGSAWTEVANVSTTRWDIIGSGTPGSGMIMGGDAPGGKQNVTEEWTVESAAVTFTSS